MKKQSNKLNFYNKKDSNGLFDGGFKSSEFKTKEEKEQLKRKSTRDYLEDIESSENEQQSEEDDLEC